jgi:hypothetical protein
MNRSTPKTDIIKISDSKRVSTSDNISDNKHLSPHRIVISDVKKISTPLSSPLSTRIQAGNNVWTPKKTQISAGNNTVHQSKQLPVPIEIISYLKTASGSKPMVKSSQTHVLSAAVKLKNISFNNSDLIKHIIWINLDRFVDKRKNMESILSNIQIPNTRISGIDGNLIDDLSQYKYTNLSKNEIARCISHIKAFIYMKSLNYEYYLVFEDDLDINNTMLFSKPIDDIIKEVPDVMKDFDIMILSKISDSRIKDTYISWNNTYDTSAYLITKRGINKIIDKINLLKNDLIIESTNIFLYKYVKTIMYNDTKSTFIIRNN